MKKTTLRQAAMKLALLAAVLLAPMVSWGQETTVTIGDGTATSNTNPIGTYYNYSITEQLYTADEIGMAGTISSISFYYRGIAARDLPITVYMMHTDAADLATAGISLADADEVFSGTLSVTTTAGWVTIELDNPFTYDGTSNLLIGCIKDYLYYFNGQTWQGTATPSTMARYSQNDNHAYTTSTTPSGTTNNRPNIQIVITPGSGPVCDKPNDPTISSITENTAFVNWDGGSGSFNVEYKKTSETDWTVAATNVGWNYMLVNLEPGTSYNVRVQSVCGSDVSNWKATSFTTACGAITTFPWTENFESYASGDFSDPCWVNEHVEGSGTYVFKISTSNNGGNSTHQLQLPDMAIGTLTKLRLPEMTLPNANYQLSIDIYRNNSTYNPSYASEGVRVYASTDGNIEGATELAFIPRHYGVSNDVIPAEAEIGWYTYALPLGVSGTCYIILRGESQYCTPTYMDNLVVEQIPTCSKPSSLVLNTPTARTAHTATLKWSNGAEGQTAWQISYSTNANFNADEGTIVDVTSNPATIENLDQNTTYYAYVRANCGDMDGLSSWCVNKTSFTTMLGNNAPSDLAVADITVSSNSATATWTGNAANTLHASYELYFSTDGETAPTAETAPTYTCTEASYTFTGLTPETQYFVWVRDNCGTDGYSAWVGPASFTTQTSCPTPVLNAEGFTNITAHTANVEWSNFAENTGYDISYRTSAYFDGVSEDFNGSSLPTTWSKYTGLLNSVMEGSATLMTGGNWYSGTANGVFNTHARTNIYGSSCKSWLVTPALTVPADGALSFDLALTNYSGTLQPPATTGTDDRFVVLITTDNMATWTILREWNNAGSEYVYNEITCSATGEHVTIGLGAYVGQNVQVAFYGESTENNADNNLHIDNVGVGITVPAGEWQTQSVSDNNYQITGLDAETAYDVKVKAYCGSVEGNESAIRSFTTPIACPAPTGLASSDITGHGATITWTAVEGASYQYAVVKTADYDEENISWSEPFEGNTQSWNNLDPETGYTFALRKDCSATEDGYSQIATTTFTTAVACHVPTNLAVNEITSSSATATWNGTSDSYLVSYRTAAYVDGIVEHFDVSGLPAGWARYNGLLNDVLAGEAELTTASDVAGWVQTTHAMGQYNMKLNIFGSSAKYWLVTPEFNLSQNLSFDLALTDYSSSNPIEDQDVQADDRFAVLIYANNAWTILREWNNSGSEYVYNNISYTGEPVSIDLSAYYGQNVKIAFYGESTSNTGENAGDNDMHIDNVICGIPYEAGEWQTVNVNETTATLTGLTPETAYEVKAQGNCGDFDGMSQETSVFSFTTPAFCAVPENLAVNEGSISPFDASFSWSSDAENWQIQLNDEEPIDLTAPSYNFTGLTPETAYSVKVRTNCGSGSYSNWSEPLTFTTGIACPAPTALEATTVTAHSITLSWTESGEATDWVVAYKTADNDNFTELPADENPYTLEDLNPETQYTVKVKADCGSTDGMSQYSTPITVTTPVACPVPTNFATSDLTAHSVTLSWTEAGSATIWTLQYGTDNTFTAGSYNEVTVNFPTADLTELTAEQTYYARVKAVCGGIDGESAWNNLNFTTPIACPAPTGLAVDAITATGATATWNGTSDNYVVQYRTSGGYDTEVIEGFEDGMGDWTMNNCHNSTGVTASYPQTHSGSAMFRFYYTTNYPQYLISPMLDSENGGTMSFFYARYSNDYTEEFKVGYSTTTNDPENFTWGDQVTVTNLYSTDGYLEYTYTIPAGAKYVAIACTSNDKFYLFIDDITIQGGEYHEPGEWVEASATDATYTFSELTPETTYEVKVKANCGDDGYSQETAPVTFTTTASCVVPTGLAVTDGSLTAHGATLTWTSTASAWEIQLGDETPITVNEATYTFTGLNPETAYSVKVRANCDGTYSNWTNPVSFTTTVACPAPTELAATLTQGNGTIATLNWTSAATAWTVEYSTADDFTGATSVTVNTTPTASLTGLTAEQLYYARVKANCGDLDGESQWSSTISFTPTDAYTLTVNDGTNTNSYVPFYGYYADDNTNSQFIIPAADLAAMQWGTIQKLTFYGSNASAAWNGAVFDVYFSEVSNTEFASAALDDWSTMTLAYTGSVSVSDNKMELTLTTPYQYMGGNLMIGFNETTNSSNYPQMSWYGVTQETNTAVYQYSSYSATLTTFLPKVTFDYTPGEEPSCIMPTGLAVNYTGGTEATVSWNSDATAFNIDVNGTVTAITTNPYTLSDLDLATTYNIMVQADCGANGTSNWTAPVSFTTDRCMPEDQCEITFILTDYYGDSWNGNAIKVIDVATNTVLGQVTNDNEDGASCDGGSCAETVTRTMAVCNGREIQFSWVNGNFADEASYVVNDVNGEEIFSGSNAMSEPVNYTVNCAATTCAKPTDLAAGTPGSRQVELSWTENGEVTAWQLCLNGDEENLIDVTTNPYTLEGLDPETSYTLKIRANCGDEQSNWTTPVSFTTPVACPAPTSLTVEDIYGHGATVNWNGFASNYNVRYRPNANFGPVLTSLDFEQSNLGDWTTIDADGDGNTWFVVNGASWDSAPHNGEDFGCSASYDQNNSVPLNPDNYLVSPQVQLGGAINFWVAAQDRSWAAEHFGVAVSTTGNTAASDFTTIQEWTMGPNAATPGAVAKEMGSWVELTVDLSAYAGQTGYVAIRHFNCSDMFYLDIDDITIYAPSQGPSEWTETTANTNSIALSGLTAETVYEFEVQANCGDEDGTSVWTSTAFTTNNVTCLTPTNLTATPAASSASIAWHGFADDYDVRYREVPYFTNFNTAADRAGWTFERVIYGIEDPVYNIPESSNFFLAMGWAPSEDDTEDTIISPELPAYPSGSTLEFYHFYYTTENTFQLGYSTTTNDFESFTWSEPIASVSAGEAYSAKYSQVLPDGVKYIAFRSTATAQSACVFIDNFIIFGAEVYTSANTNSIELTGLTPETTYEVDVKANCGGEDGSSEWASTSFTTLALEANKWYAISSPRHDAGQTYESVPNVTNLIPATGAYDLYYYNESNTTWMNYKAEEFNLEQGHGYIYRRSTASPALDFTGEDNIADVEVELTATPDAGSLMGFNLVGNPFLREYTLNRDCYNLTTNGVWTVNEGSYTLGIAEAVMVKATSDETLTFTYNEEENVGAKAGRSAALAFTLAGNGFEDVAYARFADGEGMPKLGHLNSEAPMLSIALDNRRYAIANLDYDCQSFPLVLRAKTGEYTLTAGNTEQVAYLHLLDRATGSDIDLLKQGSYTFNATSNDADRFTVKLSPDALDNAGSNFVYWNGTSWTVEGNGTLGVYDVMGRQLFSGEVNSQLSILNSQFPSTGVYILRLGEKSQKIVVK